MLILWHDYRRLALITCSRLPRSSDVPLVIPSVSVRRLLISRMVSRIVWFRHVLGPWVNLKTRLPMLRITVLTSAMVRYPSPLVAWPSLTLHEDAYWDAGILPWGGDEPAQPPPEQTSTPPAEASPTPASETPPAPEATTTSAAPSSDAGASTTPEPAPESSASTSPAPPAETPSAESSTSQVSDSLPTRNSGRTMQLTHYLAIFFDGSWTHSGRRNYARNENFDIVFSHSLQIRRSSDQYVSEFQRGS